MNKRRMLAIVISLVMVVAMGMSVITADAVTKPKKMYVKTTTSVVDIKGSAKISVYKVSPKKASKAVTFTSSNKKVATVTKSGTVKGVKAGTVKITVKSKYNKKLKKTVKITVKDLKSTSLTLNKDSMEVNQGTSATLKATMKGATGWYNQGVVWKSSRPEVATVSGGVVKGVSAGTAYITATEKNGTRKATCRVVVVGERTVFVTPQWVKSVMDGKVDGYTKDNTVIAEVLYSAPRSDAGNHVEGAIMVHNCQVEDANGKSTGSDTDFNRLYNLLDKKSMQDFLADNGISADTNVILYKGAGGSVTRQAYAYIVAGVKNVKVMEGGADAWKAAGYAMSDTYATPTPVSFGEGRDNDKYYDTMDYVKEQLYGADGTQDLYKTSDYKLVSIRSEKEFTGTTANYAYMCRGGEPEGAVWGKDSGYTREDGTYKNLYELQQTVWNDVDFKADGSQHLSFYCGTGWRATEPFLAMYQEGIDNISVYDGGWFQWSTDIAGDERYDANPIQEWDNCRDHTPLYPNNRVQIGTGSDMILTTVGEMATDKYGMKYNYCKPSVVYNAINDDNYVILDVRTVEKYNAGHIESAVSASCDSDVSGASAKPEDGDAAENIKNVVDAKGTDKTYLVICNSGNAYANAAYKRLLKNDVLAKNIKILGNANGKQGSDGGMKAWKAAGYPVVVGENKKAYGDYIVVDTEAKTLEMDAYVNGDLLDETCTQHYIVTKAGSQAASSILNSDATVEEFYAAMVAIAGDKVWNTDSATRLDPTGETNPSTIKAALEQGIGSSDFAKFDVSVSFGGNTYTMAETINTVDPDATVETIFAGNIDFQRTAGSGCLTCVGSCFAGITTGYSMPIKSQFTPVKDKLPAGGEHLTVTYTLK